MEGARFALVALMFACHRSDATGDTKSQTTVAAAPSSVAATQPTPTTQTSASAASSSAPAPAESSTCSAEQESSARSSLANAGKAAATKNWPAALASYDVALQALADCQGPVKARALAERGYVKLRAKDLDGASADLNAARDMSKDEEQLGAIHFNLALVADAKKATSAAFEETAVSLGFRANATVRARLSPCGIVDDADEVPPVRYPNLLAACKALRWSCGADASTATFCSEGLPCVVQNEDTPEAPWSIELPNDQVAGPAAKLSLVVHGDGDAVDVYKAGVRAASWRCGGAGEPVVKVSGSVILVVFEGSTGAAGPQPGCGDGYGVGSYAAISTKRRTSLSFLSLTRLGKPACR